MKSGQTVSIVRYDCRGTGLSSPPVATRLISRLRRRCATWRRWQTTTIFHRSRSRADRGSPASITYAARHPERVSHLFLWAGYARGALLFRRVESSGLGALLEKNWEMYTDTYAQAAFGWPDSATGAQYAELTRAAISQEGMVAFVRTMADVDVTAEARGMRSPLRWS